MFLKLLNYFEIENVRLCADLILALLRHMQRGKNTCLLHDYMHLGIYHSVYTETARHTLCLQTE